MYNRHYFITNGAYGDARGFYLLNTENFTERDWQDIENCPNRTRVALAHAIYKERADDNDTHDSMYEDVPQWLKLAISHVSTAMKANQDLNVANHLLEARIALNSVVEGLSLVKQLNCEHHNTTIRSGVNNQKFYECVNCGALGYHERQVQWNSGL